MPEDLAPLMAELKRLDPETWEEWKYLTETECDYCVGEAANDILQGCIQRAIAAKGLAWEMRGYQYPNEPDIYFNACIIKWVGKGRDLVSICEGDTPAAAILAAYVQACKAEATTP